MVSAHKSYKKKYQETKYWHLEKLIKETKILSQMSVLLEMSVVLISQVPPGCCVLKCGRFPLLHAIRQCLTRIVFSRACRIAITTF
jgi:hypothetical protein